MNEEEKKEIALQHLVEKFLSKQEPNTLSNDPEETDYLMVFEAISANSDFIFFSVEQDVITALWNKEERKLMQKYHIIIILIAVVILVLTIITSIIINAPLIATYYNYFSKHVIPILFIITVLILANLFSPKPGSCHEPNP